MRQLQLLLLLFLLPACVSTRFTSNNNEQNTYEAPPNDYRGFKVIGNKIVAPNERQFIPRGVNRPSFEWLSSGDRISYKDFKRMAEWGVNIVRLPLNQNFWLEEARDYDHEYKDNVDEAVRHITGLGMVVLLDLHWTNRGDLNRKAALQMMPDRHSITFWRKVAVRYKNNPLVMFDLFNEPHDVSWNTWKNGGRTREGWQAVGLQELYNAVRETGAQNVVVVGGLGWGFDLSGLPKYALHGYNIVYATHIYPQWGKETPADWENAFGRLTDDYAIIIGEVG